MNRISKHNTILTLLLCAISLLPACESPESDVDVTGDPNTAEGLAFQYILGQIARPVFYRAYNYQTAQGYCRNNYKIPVLDFSVSNAACQSDANCTVQVAKCAESSAVGTCTQSPGLESRAEDVYYSPTYSASSAASACATLNGTFSATYVP